MCVPGKSFVTACRTHPSVYCSAISYEGALFVCEGQINPNRSRIIGTTHAIPDRDRFKKMRASVLRILARGESDMDTRSCLLDRTATTRVVILIGVDLEGVDTPHIPPYACYKFRNMYLFKKKYDHPSFSAFVFELPLRIEYLLRRFVVAEMSGSASEREALSGGVVFTTLENLVETCLYYLERPDERTAIAERGRRLIEQQQEADILRKPIQNMMSKYRDDP